ncbi:MAG: mycothiol synthase, partial [Acidimicrobiales bacterium]
MHHLEVKRQMGAGDIAAVEELLEVAAVADGHNPLGEHQWLDLVDGGRTGFAGLVAWEPGHDHPVGYAQVTRGEQTWALELVVDPHHRDDTWTIGRDLVRAALDIVAEEGGGRVSLWVPKPSEASDGVATSAGLSRSRDLYQMRRPLPVGESFELATRPFEPGRDEHAWLEVNSRAFASHPEQGGWDLETLKRREAEPWFDASGFLLHERGGRLAGFVWTKVHAGHDHHPCHGHSAHLGEIYVIAVDPDFQGQGLGRQLVLAGLDLMARQGVATGMLYVDASNAGAVHLYEDVGFTVDHLDR